jgi:hypothetical protein
MTRIVHAATIGAGWLAVARLILADGIASHYDGLPAREVSLVTLAAGRLVMIVKSAHAYETECAYLSEVLADHDGGRCR